LIGQPIKLPLATILTLKAVPMLFGMVTPDLSALWNIDLVELVIRLAAMLYVRFLLRAVMLEQAPALRTHTPTDSGGRQGIRQR
jgi:hypothetical protein